jgi:hypothetical protein
MDFYLDCDRFVFILPVFNSTASQDPQYLPMLETLEMDLRRPCGVDWASVKPLTLSSVMPRLRNSSQGKNLRGALRQRIDRTPHETLQ